MGKNKFLTMVIILLLLLNLGTLGFLFFSRPPQPEMPPPFTQMLQKELQLNDSQVAQINAVHNAHMHTMDSLSRNYDAALQQYFQLLQQDNFSQQLKDSLQNQLACITSQKALSAFMHFHTINTLLNAAQSEKYKALLPQILRPLLRNPQNPPPAKD